MPKSSYGLSPKPNASRRLMQALSALFVLSAALLTSSAEAQWLYNTTWSAISGGYDVNGSGLIVCRALDPQVAGTHPGKTQIGWNYCSYAYGGLERFTTNYQTLPPSWVPGTAQGGTQVGSDGGTALSVCRASIGGSLQVGKHLRGVNSCAIPYGGSEVWVSPYSVLTDANFSFVATSAIVNQMEMALIGGYESNGNTLYPCLAQVAGQLFPGKMQKNWNACVYPYGGSEVWTSNYSVLVPRFDLTNLNTGTWPILVTGTDSNGAQLGSCRATINGSLQVGKYLFANNQCFISYGGAEHYISSTFWTLRRRP